MKKYRDEIPQLTLLEPISARGTTTVRQWSTAVPVRRVLVRTANKRKRFVQSCIWQMPIGKEKQTVTIDNIVNY